MAKTSKISVSYSHGMKESHCGKVFEDDRYFCKHFQKDGAGNGTCSKVEGTINPLYWCELYAKAAS